MSEIFSVSIPNTDEDLTRWLKKQIKEKTISLSAVFQQAVKERKKDWDIINSVSPEQLIQKIKSLEQSLTQTQETIGKQSAFIEHHNLTSDWINYALKPKEEKLKIQEGSKTIIKEKQILKSSNAIQKPTTKQSN